MPTKKKTKMGPRLRPEQRAAMRNDIKLGILSDTEIARTYGIGPSAVCKARRRLKEAGGPPKPLSVLEMKKILNLDKADSFLVYLMEQGETMVKNIVEAPSKEKAMALDAMGKFGTFALNTRNALAFAPPQETGDISEVDKALAIDFMKNLPEEMKDPFMYLINGGRKDAIPEDTKKTT